MEDTIKITIILATILIITLISDKIANKKFDKIKINQNQIPLKYLKKTESKIKSLEMISTYTNQGIYISTTSLLILEHHYFIKWNEIKSIKKKELNIPFSNKFSIYLELEKENKKINIGIITDDEKDYNIVKEHIQNN